MLSSIYNDWGTIVNQIIIKRINILQSFIQIDGLIIYYVLWYIYIIKNSVLKKISLLRLLLQWKRIKYWVFYSSMIGL